LQRANGGTSKSTIVTPVHNAGTVVAAADQTLDFESGLSNLAGGTVSVDGVLQGQVSLSGGSLTRAGEVTGDVTNSAGTVSPGHSPGVLTIDGKYTQGASGTLAVDVAGTTAGSGFDQLAVSGAAVLAGTLAIVRDPSFSPTAGQTFSFL